MKKSNQPETIEPIQEQELDERIVKLAKTLLTNDLDSFEALAKQEAVGLGVWDLLRLDYKLLNNPPVHPLIDERSLGLGGWLWLCQHTIHELIYNIGTDALEYLRSVAFGEYDWPQATAMETICRLYSDKKIPVDIIQAMDENFGNLRYETMARFIRKLMQRGERDERFKRIIALFKSVHFYAALKEIENNDGKTMSRKELIELGKRIMAQEEQEEDMQALMETFDENVPYPKGSRLFYFPEGFDGSVDELPDYNPAVEEVVDKCLAYKSIKNETEFPSRLL